MAGDIFPKNGHPVYLPAEMQLPEAATPQEAEQMAEGYMKMGLDGVKLFTDPFMETQPVVSMDTAIAKIAVEVGMRRASRCSLIRKTELASTMRLPEASIFWPTPFQRKEVFTPDELAQMKRQHTALIPSLTLWTTVFSGPAAQDRLLQAGVDELKQYFSEGGTILFGTDVGSQSKYDTTQEFEFMGRAMSWRDILAWLATNPSSFFKAGNEGRVERHGGRVGGARRRFRHRCAKFCQGGVHNSRRQDNLFSEIKSCGLRKTRGCPILTEESLRR